MKQEYLTRKKYEKPEVTVVEFAIERGFLFSGQSSTSDYNQGSHMNGFSGAGNSSSDYGTGSDWDNYAF